MKLFFVFVSFCIFNASLSMDVVTKDNDNNLFVDIPYPSMHEQKQTNFFLSIKKDTLDSNNAPTSEKQEKFIALSPRATYLSNTQHITQKKDEKLYLIDDSHCTSEQNIVLGGQEPCTTLSTKSVASLLCSMIILSGLLGVSFYYTGASGVKIGIIALVLGTGIVTFGMVGAVSVINKIKEMNQEVTL